MAVPALQILVDGTLAWVGAHHGTAGVVRALVRHHCPRLGARDRGVELGRVHAPGDIVYDVGRVLAHLVLVGLVVEGHSHQRLSESVAIGRIEIIIIVAVAHYAAARGDVHRGLVPFRGGRLPCRAPLRGAARHRSVADGQEGVEAGGDVIPPNET